MDKQLIEEFNKIYFSKRAITKRVYNIDDVNNIWEELTKKRKNTAITTKLELKRKDDVIWYNVCEKIQNLTREIDEIITSDIVKYIPKRNREKLKKETKLREYEDITQGDNRLEENQFNNLFISCHYNSKNKVLDNILASVPNNDNNLKEIFRQLNYFLLEDQSHILIKAAIGYYYLINQEVDNNKLIANISTYYYLKQSGYNNMYYQGLFKYFNEDKFKHKKIINESLDHENDATYFIMYFLEALKQMIVDLNSEISSKFGKKIIMDMIEVNNIDILSRQLNFVLDNIDNEKRIFTIADYRESTSVVYETARTDLNNLITLGFFKISKFGKKFLYHLNDLGMIIDNLQY